MALMEAGAERMEAEGSLAEAVEQQSISSAEDNLQELITKLPRGTVSGTEIMAPLANTGCIPTIWPWPFCIPENEKFPLTGDPTRGQ
jgi:hypothetical protein